MNIITDSSLPFGGPDRLESSDDGAGITPLFYARCSAQQNFQDTKRIIIQCACTEDARAALESRDLVIQTLVAAQTPREPNFSYRPDGTILVGSSRRAERFQVFGPFNDDADARRWVSHQPINAAYSLIEPDECLQYKRVNDQLIEVIIPSDLLNGPL